MKTTRIQILRAAALPKAMFDVNADDTIDETDHRIWVKDLAHTWYGDADFNGEFNSADFLQAFQASKYEAAQDAGWSEGDWNGDGVFDSDDFITAFQDGGYEQGPRMDVAAVPEPGAAATAIASLAVVAACCRWRKLRARSASCHLSNQPIPRRAVGNLKARMAKWSLWHLG